VRLAPVAVSALALLDDGRDGGLGGGQVGDRDQLRPAQPRAGGLGLGRADEHLGLAVALDQAGEAVADAAVQVPDGRVVLRFDHQGGRGRGQGPALAHHREQLGVGHVDVVGALQVQEVTQRRLAERHQRHLHVRRVPLAADREVGPVEMRGGADRGQQVGRQGQVQHLLDRDLGQGVAPAGDQGELLGVEPVAGLTLEGVQREQVLAEDPLFQLGGLGEQVDELLATVDGQRRQRAVGRRPAVARDHPPRRRRLRVPPLGRCGHGQPPSLAPGAAFQEPRGLTTTLSPSEDNGRFGATRTTWPGARPMGTVMP
jgi:hypothetical protein